MTYRKSFFSPCKVNYMLAITGARADGFHNLLSVVAPTRFGDELFIEEAGEDSIACNLEGVPCDESNLVMKAAAVFRRATMMNRFFKFELVKKVPHGAGLGGGSSNGAVALLALNKICGEPLSMGELERLSATLGSDCPLFLSGKPVVMRGRGEEVSDLPQKARELIASLKLLIFKPDFSINTGLAYKRMKELKTIYIPSDKAEKMFEEWIKNPTIESLPLVNNMQIPAFEKFPALEAILNFVKKEYKLPCLMSGSGSACFAILNGLDPDALPRLKADIRARLGGSCFIAEA
ncbi:MAG: 4-(cytidine 5'-diphospho)-2-C-methyl-D-erythritol kinase [Opitutales bacterium]|nr:4-(cytidine 5'-diphospho)-2-C-methyl-D-erythritol kinase [Opitutales bacterium]